MADRAGIEFMLPIGRWKGYGGDTDYQGATWETVTWACGLLAKNCVRDCACAASRAIDRRQGVCHCRPYRRGPLWPQPRLRLERGRVRDVWRDIARSRGAL